MDERDLIIFGPPLLAVAGAWAVVWYTIRRDRREMAAERAIHARTRNEAPAP